MFLGRTMGSSTYAKWPRFVHVKVTAYQIHPWRVEDDATLQMPRKRRTIRFAAAWWTEAIPRDGRPPCIRPVVTQLPGSLRCDLRTGAAIQTR